MFDLDPRELDSRDDERGVGNRGRDARDSADAYDDDDWRQPEIRGRDRHDDEARELGRGPGSDSRGAQHADGDRCGPDDDPRWPERERDARTRDLDARDVFARQLDLPRGLEREIVRYRDREYTLRGSESRTLAAVAAVRVVSSRDLVDARDRPADPRSGDLRHLREQGLVETVCVPGYRDRAVALTKSGRGLLERNRNRTRDHRQTFYAGVKRHRELEHDVQVYRAYLHEAERLHEHGARIGRIVLDYELKREYQEWLHARDRDQDHHTGRPDRTPDEIQEWALDRDLPYFDREVHFPDVRIEYQEPDGRWAHEDIEVVTPHYRGAHGASVARSGFVCFRGTGATVGGGRSPDPRLAAELLR